MARRRKARDDLAAVTANPPQHIPPGPVRADFAVIMPGYRVRHDGWNQARLQRFLDGLAHTGCVEDGARVAGMSAVAARRALKRYPLFATAWGEALERSRQGLIAIAYQRAVEGRQTVIIRKGEEYERRISPSDSMLTMLIKRGDLADGGGAAVPDELADLIGLPRDQILTFDEWKGHMRFSQYGDKYQAPDPAEVDRQISERSAMIRTKLNDMALRGEECPCCDQPLPPDWPKQSLAQLIFTGVIKAVDLYAGIEMEED
jgi:hypothetical protein